MYRASTPTNSIWHCKASTRRFIQSLQRLGELTTAAGFLSPAVFLLRSVDDRESQAMAHGAIHQDRPAFHDADAQAVARFRQIEGQHFLAMCGHVAQDPQFLFSLIVTFDDDLTWYSQRSFPR